MIGLMNAGLSGSTLGHSDIGGYTSVYPEFPIRLFFSYTRSKTLLQRWIEMSTFSDVIMRSHPSSSPDHNYQIFDDEDTILFFKKFTEIHVKMADYKMQLMQEANQKGTPFTRPMLLHFPHDKRARLEHS